MSGSLLGEVKSKQGAFHRRKVRGRGDGSGLGSTAGKGHKGQKARTGGRVRWGFEGGQTPLMRRLPKFGFSNESFRVSYETVSLQRLSKLTTTEINVDVLKREGFVSGRNPVKILGGSALSTKLNVEADGFSASARAEIEKSGGKATIRGSAESSGS